MYTVLDNWISTKLLLFNLYYIKEKDDEYQEKIIYIINKSV